MRERVHEDGWRAARRRGALDLDGALLRGEDFGFVVLELGRGEALGIDEGLLALVVGGDGGEIGFGDLDVVAEDGVEANFEGADAGAAALALFDGGDGLRGRRPMERSSSSSASMPGAMTPPSARVRGGSGTRDFAMAL